MIIFLSIYHLLFASQQLYEGNNDMHQFPVKEAQPTEKCEVGKVIGDGRILTDDIHLQSHRLSS